MAKPIPDGFHSVTPQITVKDADRALEFTSGHSARKRWLFSGPGGLIMHAEMTSFPAWERARRNRWAESRGRFSTWRMSPRARRPSFR